MRFGAGFLLLLAALGQVAAGARILLLYCPNAKTHLFSYLPLLQRLGDRGHNVTVFHIDEKPAPSLGRNIDSIDLVLERDPERVKEFASIAWTKTGHGFLIPMIFYFGEEAVQRIVTEYSPQFKQVLAGDYDLVVVDELFSLHGALIAHLLYERRGIPYVIYSPSHQMSFYQEIVALSRSYTASQALFTPLPLGPNDQFKPARFTDRLVSVLESQMEAVLMNVVLPFFTQSPSQIGVPEFRLSSFFSRGWLTFGEHIDRLGAPVTESNDLALIGSHCISASNSLEPELPAEWKDFLEDPKSKGTIYIALGSTTNWDGAPGNIKEEFVGGLADFTDYRIVFGFKGEFPENSWSHVRFTKWAPQMAILKHSKTKVFVTHAGLKSLKEALCSETAVVLMPILAEQSFNAKYALKLGFGLVLNKYHITREKVASTIRQVLEDPSYTARVSRAKRIYLDRASDPLDFGSHKVEKLIRLRAKHGALRYDAAHERLMRRRGRLQAHWQFFHLDWAVLVLGCLVYVVSK